MTQIHMLKQLKNRTTSLREDDTNFEAISRQQVVAALPLPQVYS